MSILSTSQKESSGNNRAYGCLTYNMGMSEEQLWIKFKDGDQDAFEFIFKKYHPILYGYGRKLFPDSNDLDDSIQELFLKLWKKRDSLSEVLSIKAYLLKAFRRIALERVQKNRRYTGVSEYGHYDVALSVEDMLISEEAGKEQKDRLRHSIEKLTKRQKEIIYLRFYEGLSYEEIESVVQINYQTIRNCVYEAIKVLKKDLLSISIGLLPGVELLL